MTDKMIHPAIAAEAKKALDAMDFPPRIFPAPTKRYRDGEPCDHAGCLSHVSHPCEGCGRVAGRYVTYPLADDWDGSHL